MQAEGAAKLPSMEPSLYNYATYFSKLPPVVVDRWMIPLDSFNSQSFRLIGEGNFSSVYLCKVQCPLATPTKHDKYRTYSEQAVAVKLLVGTYVIHWAIIYFKNTLYFHTHQFCLCFNGIFQNGYGFIVVRWILH